MVLNFKKLFEPKSYFSVSLMGKNLQLDINYSKVNNVEMNILENEVEITLPIKYKDNMDIINLCVQKMYSKVASTELEYAMEFARHTLGFAPEDFKIKRLDNSYYKYSNKTLIINPDIVQFNKEVIYTTIIKAFCKIKYRSGSKNYFNALEIGLKECAKYRREEPTKELWMKVS